MNPITRADATASLDTLRSRTEAMVLLLEELAAIETPSTEPALQAQALDLLARELAGRRYQSRRFPGTNSGGVLYAVPQGGVRRRPRQLLLGHVDTVWPVGTVRRMPVHRNDGRLYGPGVYDMKGGLVQMLFALEALGEAPAVAPVVLVTTDEEIGSGESAELIRHSARRADRVLVLEPALGPAGHLKTARKGVGRFVVRVRGQAAHAGLDPEKGASAILELSRVVQYLFELNDPAVGTTINVGTIDGGIRPNVVAAESRAEVDVRVRTREAGNRITEAIRALRPSTPGTELQIDGRIGRPPMEPAASRELMALASAAAAELGLTIDGAEAGGASDGNLTAPYAPTLDGLGAVGDGAHADHEHVVIERMPERAALLARLLAASPLRSEGESEGESAIDPEVEAATAGERR